MASNFGWSTDVTSGVSRNHAISGKLRYASIAQTRMVQFCRPEEGFSEHMGDTLTIQRIRNTATPTSSVLTQTGKIPIDTLAMSTKSITVSEFGRAIGFNRYAQILLNFDLEDPIQKTLMKQMKLTIDTVAATQFKQAKIRYAPLTSQTGQFTTDGGATSAVALVNLNVSHVQAIYDYMQDTIHVDPYEGDYYMCLASIKSCRGIKRDTEWQNWRNYLEPDLAFYNGEIGMIEQTRFIAVNHLGALTNNKGTNGVLGEAVFFGDDPVAIAEVQPPELLMGMPSDFGRKRAIAWNGILAFGIVWDTANDGEARIVYVTSS